MENKSYYQKNKKRLREYAREYYSRKNREKENYGKTKDSKAGIKSWITRRKNGND